MRRALFHAVSVSCGLGAGEARESVPRRTVGRPAERRQGIGAGDAAFLQQAKERMRSFVSEAGLLVLASHADDLLRQWCTTAIWMEHGRMRMHAGIDEVLEAYHDSLAAA